MMDKFGEQQRMDFLNGNKKCLVCGETATVALRDMVRDFDHEKDGFKSFLPIGDVKYFCDKHKRNPIRYGDE